MDPSRLMERARSQRNNALSHLAKAALFGTATLTLNFTCYEIEKLDSELQGNTNSPLVAIEQHTLSNELNEFFTTPTEMLSRESKYFDFFNLLAGATIFLSGCSAVSGLREYRHTKSTINAQLPTHTSLGTGRRNGLSPITSTNTHPAGYSQINTSHPTVQEAPSVSASIKKPNPVVPALFRRRSTHSNTPPRFPGLDREGFDDAKRTLSNAFWKRLDYYVPLPPELYDRKVGQSHIK